MYTWRLRMNFCCAERNPMLQRQQRNFVHDGVRMAINRKRALSSKRRMAKAKTFPERLRVIVAARREANLSARGLADLAGLPHSTLQSMDRSDWSPNIRTAAAVERALMSLGVI